MKFIALFSLLLVSACGPPADAKLQTRQDGLLSVVTQNGAVSVTRIGVFQDDLAYDGKRGIYLIRDERTGIEYIGLSGVGISERGEHAQGKQQVPDER